VSVVNGNGTAPARESVGDGASVAPIPRLALDVSEACAALGVSWKLWRQQIEPSVRVVRVGRRKLVSVTELERWLAENGDRVGDSV
jgi:hypothetical protein